MVGTVRPILKSARSVEDILGKVAADMPEEIVLVGVRRNEEGEKYVFWEYSPMESRLRAIGMLTHVATVISMDERD